MNTGQSPQQVIMIAGGNVLGGRPNTFNPAAPGPIGGTTPAAGAFTTISATGQITSTLAIGTAPFAITSTTVVPNLNVSQLLGATWAAPGSIGSGTPAAGAFTTGAFSGTITSSADGTLFSRAGASTNFEWFTVANTSGSIGVGIEGSSVAIITGATAYDAVFRGKSGISFSANEGTNLHARMASTGAMTFKNTFGSDLSGVAMVLTNATTTTGASVGTLTNCPHTGNPTLYLEVSVNGSVYAIPCFGLS